MTMVNTNEIALKVNIEKNKLLFEVYTKMGRFQNLLCNPMNKEKIIQTKYCQEKSSKYAINFILYN